MIKIMFVCLGNICRSPMAEFVFRDIVQKKNLSQYFQIASAGTSDEEEGNLVHRGTREELLKHGIICSNKRARKLVAADYDEYDYLIGMEERNLVNMRRFFGGDRDGKMSRLLDFSSCPRDITDPWYTGNFDITYRDINEGCTALLCFLLDSKKI